MKLIEILCQQGITGILSPGPIATEQECGPVPDLESEQGLKRRRRVHLTSVAVSGNVLKGAFYQHTEAVKRRASGKFPLEAFAVAVLQAGYKVVQFLPFTGNHRLEAGKGIIAGCKVSPPGFHVRVILIA